MDSITVDKARLLATLEANRTEHREMFDRAQVAYRVAVIKALDERLERAKNGDKIDVVIRMPEPKDYTEEFDRVISMLGWQEGDTVELDEHDFRRYVLNQWEWASQFAQNTMSYLAQ